MGHIPPYEKRGIPDGEGVGDGGTPCSKGRQYPWPRGDGLLGSSAPYARYPLENTSQSPQQICQITIYIPTVQSRFCQVVGTRCSTYSTSVDNRHNARLFTSYATFEGLTVSPSFSLQPPFDALSCLSMPPSRSVGILLFSHLFLLRHEGLLRASLEHYRRRRKERFPGLSRLMAPIGRQGSGAGPYWVGEIMTPKALTVDHYIHNVNIYACAFGRGQFSYL